MTKVNIKREVITSKGIKAKGAVRSNKEVRSPMYTALDGSLHPSLDEVREYNRELRC